MTSITPTSNDSSQALALLEKHKKRLETLSARQTRVQVQLENAREQYAQAVEQAKLAFGTADVSQLEKLLEEKVAANNKAVKGFIEAINEFEAHLERIEQALADPVALEAFLQSLPDDAVSQTLEDTQQQEAATFQEAVFAEEDI